MTRDKRVKPPGEVSAQLLQGVPTTGAHMNKLKLQQLLDLINDIVNDPDAGSWTERRDLILGSCTDSEKTNLLEFTAWFEGAE